MNKLEDFNKQVEALGQELTNLQAVSAAYQKISSLAKEYEEIKKNIATAVSSLEKSSLVLISEKDLLEKKMQGLVKLVDEKIEALNVDTKRNYNNLITTVQTRLDNNKMEIKQLIDQDSQSTRVQIGSLKSEVSDIKRLVQDTQRTTHDQLQTESVKLQGQVTALKHIVIGLCVTTLVAVLSVLCMLLFF